MKRILVISESIDVEDSSASKVNVALIKNLIVLGYELKVLHYSRKDIKIRGATCIAVAELSFSLNYVLSRAQRVFQRITNRNISKPLENLFGHSFTFFNDSKSIAKAVKKYYNNEDLIITLSKGASFRPHHALLAHPELHVKWLAYVHDPYPFHCYPKPYDWVEAGHKFKEEFFRKVSECANYSAFPSLRLKEWMGQFYPKFLNTAIIIPHQYLVEDKLEKIDISNFIKPEQFTVLHAGNLMKQRNPKGLIEGFKLFLKQHPQAKAKLLLLGPADFYKTYLEDVCDEHVYWSQGYMDYKHVEAIQNVVSVNVILEANSKSSPFLPGKFPNCIKANKPILHLGPYNSETRRLLGDNYNYSFEILNEFAIAKALMKLYQLWEEYQKLELSRPDLEAYLSLEHLNETFKKVL